MSDRFEQLKSRAKLKTWRAMVAGQEERFRALTELEKSSLSLLGMKLSKSGEVEIDSDLGKQREKLLRTICYQWVDANGDHVIDPSDWAKLGELPSEVVEELRESCLAGDGDTQDESAALKN